VTAPAKLHPRVRAEIARRLNDGASVYRVSKDLALHISIVRGVRDDLGIPAGQQGNHRLAAPEPVRWDDTDDVDGNPQQASPLRIPPGMWCMERPNQAAWLALVKAAATKVETEALRLAMARVLGLPLTATDGLIEDTLRAESRTAEELAGLYLAARGTPC
jgi:hypothetical protein